MSYNISITKVEKSKVDALDFNNIPLGTTFTDHMFVCDYENGTWQAIFEGMKAYKDTEGAPMLFRPEQNAKRLNKSADRMGMPNVPEELFVDGLKELVGLEHNWIPPQQGSALYLRPFMYADEPFIGMRAATHYKFIIMASPAGPFFSNNILEQLLVELVKQKLLEIMLLQFVLPS